MCNLTAARFLLRVNLPPRGGADGPAEAFARVRDLVDTLMGRRPELRFDYIQKNARFVHDLNV